LCSQAAELFATELLLLRGPQHLTKRRLRDAPEAVFRIHVMITRIKTSIMLKRQRVSTGFGKDTKRRGAAQPESKLHIKELDKHLADVSPEPRIENIAQKLAICTRAHAPGCDAALSVHVHLRSTGKADTIATFNNWNELDKAYTKSLQEPVNLFSLAAIGAVYCRQYIVFNLMMLKYPQTSHHRIKGRTPRAIDSVSVMYIPRSVETNPDKKIIVSQKLAPIVVKKRSVGLQRIRDPHALRRILLLKRDYPSEVVHSKHCWLPALPRKVHFGPTRFGRRFDHLTDIGIENIVRHTKFFLIRKHFFLLEIIAIFAVNIAPRPNGFGHNVKGTAGRHLWATLRLEFLRSRVRESNRSGAAAS